MVNIKDVPRNEDGSLPAYAWPGGYPIYYLDGEDSALCVECANKSDTKEEIPHFRPIAAAINYEDSALFCDSCSERIESAYAEEDEETK